MSIARRIAGGDQVADGHLPWIIASVAVSALAAIGVAAWINSRRFGRRIHRDVQRMFTDSPGPLPIERRRLEELPAPVRRFLVRALGARALALRTIRLRHGGTFRTSLDAHPLPVVGEEYFVSDPPGFLWWGRLRIAPGVWVDACDRSLAGVGNLRIAAESTLILGDNSGPAMDQGEMLRLLAEMVLIPSAFLDERHVIWMAIDDRTARATLRVNGREASGLFEFAADGLPNRFSADRDRDVGKGKSVSTPWSGELSDYREIDGLTVPFRFVACWHVDGKRIPYADFVVEQFEPDVAAPF